MPPELQSTIASLSWVDWVLLVVLVASVIVGMVRGFVFECLSLAGWIVAWFAAQWAAPLVAPQLPVGTPGGSLNLGASFLLCFVLAIVVWSLLSRLIRLLIQSTPLSIPDRLLGAGFGVLRAGVLLLAVATVITFTPAAQSQGWRQSQGARWLGQILVGLKPLLPEQAARFIKA